MKQMLVLFFSLNLFASLAQSPSPEAGGRIPGVLVVGLEAGQAAGHLLTICDDSWNCRLDRPVSAQHNRQRLLFDESVIAFDKLQQLFEEQAGVQWVQADYVLELRSTVPNDGYFPSQWSLELIGAANTWTASTGGITANGDSIVVAILDSGYDLEHPDLQGQYWRNPAELNGGSGIDDDQNGYSDDVFGWNFNLNSPNHPPDFHGTAVAGIIGARGNNGEGVAGINWNVRIMPLTVRTVSHIIEAYYYALFQRERYEQTQGLEGAYVVVTNASLGISRRFCDEFPGLNEVYNQLGEAGILSVAATSNSDYDVDVEGDMPTSCASQYLISVTNTDRNDRKVFGAAYGLNSIDLGAPGGPGNDGVIAPNPGFDYRESFGGASASCPHVAGAIALLYSMPCEQLATMLLEDPEAAAMLIQTTVLETTRAISDLDGITVTGGRLDLYAAMQYLHSYCQDFEVDPFYPTFTDERDFLRVYPNPINAGQALEVVYTSPDFSSLNFRFFNTLGQLIWQERVDPAPFEQQRYQLQTTNLQRGTYILVIDNGKEPIPMKIMVW